MDTIKKLPKIIVIVGPTASGKTNYSIDLAKKIDGEIISADSRQVYTELNFGSGKVTQEEMQNIKHYGLDIDSVGILSKDKNINVEIWREQAEKDIQKILEKNKTPIIVGGTMHWIDTLVMGKKFSEVKPDKELRESLEKLDIDTLLEKLKSLDENYYKKIINNNSDSKNKRRIIRGIEIAMSVGSVEDIKYEEKYEIEWVGLSIDREKLRERITERLEKRWQNIIIEVKSLIDTFGKEIIPELIKLGLEYKYTTLYVINDITEDKTKEKIVTSSMQYARRQMSWWKKSPNIKWIEVK